MDILDKIDAATAPVCGWCSAPLAEDGPSLDFCTLEHQQVWAARLGEPITGYREAGLGGMDTGEWSPVRAIVDMLNRQSSLSRVRANAIVRGDSARAVVYTYITPDLSGFTASLAAAQRAAERLVLGTSPELVSIDETRNWSPAGTEGTFLNPMQAAIELRRRRNTGPALRRRAPKNIGWGRP